MALRNFHDNTLNGTVKTMGRKKLCCGEISPIISETIYEIDRNLLRVTSIGSQLSDRTVTFDDHDLERWDAMGLFFCLMSLHDRYRLINNSNQIQQAITEGQAEEDVF